MNKMLTSAAIFAILLVGSVLFSGSASATPANQCGIDLVTGDTACFTTITSLESWDQQDQNSGGDAVAKVRNLGLRRAATAAGTSYLLGTIYRNKNYGGGTYSFFQSSGCDGNHSDWEWEFGDLQDVSFNDDVDSFQGHSNCYMKLYENKNYNSETAGSTYGPYGSTTYVGDAMHDQASSIRWY